MGNPIFAHFVSGAEFQKDFALRLYDLLFLDCLTEVKAIDPIRKGSILDRISKGKAHPLLKESLDA